MNAHHRLNGVAVGFDLWTTRRLRCHVDAGRLHR
jgi:hypothetical protein